MEPIKVHIEKLGLIKDSDIVISPMMVFSGESGLGKSYLAILCHYFFFVWTSQKRLHQFFEGKGIDFSETSSGIPDAGTAYIMNRTDLEEWLATDAISYLRYMLGFDGLDAKISVSLPESISQKISFTFEQELMGLNNAEDLYYKLSALGIVYRFKQLGIRDESPYAIVLRFAIIDVLFGDYKNLSNTFVLPPSRGSFLSEDLYGRTGLYKSFESGMRELENAQEIPDIVSNELVDLFNKVLDGEVKREGEKYMYYTHDDIIPASSAASSVREIAPLQILIHKRDISKIALLVEEPEAHLHPMKQIMMADILALMVNGKANIQITTHSDYFLRRINDLIRLDMLKNLMGEKDYNTFCEDNKIDGKLTLSANGVSAYYLQKTITDGKWSVKVMQQDIQNGIPFDTFTEVNQKPLTDSVVLYDKTTEMEENKQNENIN